jgi:Gnt-I system high-affinity gluconate transporter
MFYVLASILLLVLLITWAKIQPFLAFLVASIFAGIVLSIPLTDIPIVLERGIGKTLNSLLGIICLGAMFGKLVAQSGAAQKIASVLINLFGVRHVTWALMLTGFIVGIPLFYNVGFVLLVPLVFSVAIQAGLPPVYLGVALLSSLSVTHGFLPPHPSPTAMIPMFNASMSTTLIYGFVVAVPAMVIAGPLFARFFRNSRSQPLALFVADPIPQEQLPSAFNCFATSLLPVALIASAALLPAPSANEPSYYELLRFLSQPLVVMLLSLGVATLTLGLSRGIKIQALMDQYSAAVKEIAVILLIVAGAGALKEVFDASGVSKSISALLQGLPVNPLILGWLLSLLIRVSLGSATVAGLTAAGIMAPVVAANPNVNPNLMVLAIGAGSLMFSHVNDSGFWMFKEYFNLSIKQTLASWSLMEGIVGVVGIIGVLVLDRFV